MQRLFLTFLLIGVVGLILVCSNSGTDSNDNETPADSGFTVACVGDNTASVSQAFTASAGGTIEAVSADGVTFTLEIPAYSLPADNNITLTPLDSFTADGPAYFNCIDVGGGTGLCFEGVMCQPEGLEFDSGATLTVTFPEATPFPFDSGTVMIYFDTAGSVLYACSTIIDQAERSLSCAINHFSGYTTANIPEDEEDDPCAMLIAEYNPLYQAAYSVAGYPEFLSLALRLYEMKAGNYRSDPYNSGQGWIPCSSFNDQVDADFVTLLNRHLSVLQSRYQSDDPTASAIGELIAYHRDLLHFQAYLTGTTAQSTCEQVIRDLHLFIDGRIRALATIGHTMCQNDNCDGEDVLEDVLSFGDQGYVVTSGLVVDAAYLQQVTAWRDDCCNNDLTVTLSAPAGTTIHRIALDQDEVYADPYSFVCSLNVVVTAPSGTPKPGIPVRLWRTGESRHFTTFTTDDDGNAGFLLEPRSLDWGCLSEITWEIYADAYNEEEEWITSGTVSITFLNMEVTTAISYRYDYSWEGGESHLFKTATLEGSGTSIARDGGLCTGSCEGKLTRDYYYDNCFHNMGDSDVICVDASTIGGDSTYPCRASMDFRTMLLDNGLRVEFLYGATVSVGASAFTGLIYAKSIGYIDTLHYGLQSGAFPETPIKLWYADSTGNVIGDSTWTYYHEHVVGTTPAYQTASLHVNVTFAR